MEVKTCFLSCLLLLASLNVMAKPPHYYEDCEYKIQVRTGKKSGAGTNSEISIELIDPRDWSNQKFPNLEIYGTEGAKHDYFENGNVDNFLLQNQHCISICAIYLKSDGKGWAPGWYPEKVIIEVSSKTPKTTFPPYKKEFDFNEWINGNGIGIQRGHC